MSSTQVTMAAIIEFFKWKADATFHPSLFTMTDHTYRLGMPHAIRKLKAQGLLEIAYQNINGQPVYKASDAMKDLAASVPN